MIRSVFVAWKPSFPPLRASRENWLPQHTDQVQQTREKKLAEETGIEVEEVGHLVEDEGEVAVGAAVEGEAAETWPAHQMTSRRR